jgi:elongation factor Ts
MQLIKDLRSQSGAPISECKKALEATSDGSIEEAMDWLRQHGAAKASAKAQGREAAEGLVGLRVAGDGSAAAIIRISSETDFASRSAAFVNLVTHAVDATLAQTNVQGIVEQDVLLSSEYNGKSVKDALDEAVVAIRENLGVSSAMRLGSDQGRFVGYVHGRVEGSPVVGTAASVVHVVGKNKSDVPDEVLKDAGKKLAMHVVAAKPQYLTPDDVPEDVVAKEKDILMQQMADSGKPADILEKIVDGRMRKFYEGVCLTEQPHMVEEKNPKVSKVLDTLGIQVTQFELKSIS